MDSLFSAFTARLERAGWPYMVTGSVAAMIYGEPRLTHDVDLVLELDAAAVERFGTLFPDEQFYCPPAEVIRVENQRSLRGHFNVIEHETGFKADVYLMGRDALHRWAMQHRRDIEYDGHRIHVAPPEYVIVRKLEFYREGKSEKHLQDIRGMLRHSGEDMDRPQLYEMVRERGLSAEWALVAET